MSKTFIAAVVGLAIAAAPVGTSEKIDPEINTKIRAEAQNNSQIMRTMHFLTDVHGPRLTGSPNHKRAAEWAVNQMTEWGFKNGRLEPWAFVNADGTPRSGWLNERFSGHIVSPVKDSLVGEVLAWTPSTKGTVTAAAINIIAPSGPTQAELDKWIAETTPDDQRKDGPGRPAHDRPGHDRQDADCAATTMTFASSWTRTPPHRKVGADAADVAGAAGSRPIRRA